MGASSSLKTRTKARAHGAFLPAINTEAKLNSVAKNKEARSRLTDWK